jgi:hypothetical protein
VRLLSRNARDRSELFAEPFRALAAGFLGHTSGYKTTARYAKYGPDHLGEAVRAIDDYFAELGLSNAPQRTSASVACE